MLDVPNTSAPDLATHTGTPTHAALSALYSLSPFGSENLCPLFLLMIPHNNSSHPLGHLGNDAPFPTQYLSLRRSHNCRLVTAFKLNVVAFVLGEEASGALVNIWTI